MDNPYLPLPVRIEKITVETADKNIKTFRLAFLNPDDEHAFQHQPGQFAQLSVAGTGECPIGIASSPTESGFLLFTVNRAGVVTTRLHEMEEGDILGVRGPLGRPYPLRDIEGKNLVIIGGGFAFTTLRATVVYLLEEENRKRFGDVSVVYGARNEGMLLYREELAAWEKRPDINMHITVDRTEDPNWKYNVGFVPAITEQKIVSAKNSVAIICGPPIMIKFTQPVLEKVGFPPEAIIMSLENRMKCGIGMCGRCNVGPQFVCKDGPVFTLAELHALPAEY
ncbi:MAG: FAD/NAD(P)-binding protein [Deltaproteobacteria bacterium]|nr:FAD/NAD(P)-binding protein [Deltaproteobacteria bacterium]